MCSPTPADLSEKDPSAQLSLLPRSPPKQSFLLCGLYLFTATSNVVFSFRCVKPREEETQKTPS